MRGRRCYLKTVGRGGWGAEGDHEADVLISPHCDWRVFAGDVAMPGLGLDVSFGNLVAWLGMWMAGRMVVVECVFCLFCLFCVVCLCLFVCLFVCLFGFFVCLVPSVGWLVRA